MIEKIEKIKGDINDFSETSAEGIESFRVKYISKKSIINDLFEEFKKLSDVIIANRITEEIKDIESKVYTRDIFNTD